MKRFIFSILALLAIATGSQAQNAINGHEYVDLGLPSGILWATMNVGASSIEDPGDYFAWGETVSKTDYTWENYSELLVQKYTRWNPPFLENCDDVANVFWGGAWRMPYKDEVIELADNCTITTNNAGVILTSKINGKSIFFPYNDITNYYHGENTPICSMWTRTNDESHYAWDYHISDFGLNVERFAPREYGEGVRAIYDPRTHVHDFLTESDRYYFDGNNHYHTCIATIGTCDGSIVDVAPHTFNSNNTCSVCDFEKITTPHTHSYATTWSWNESIHWHACTSTIGYCDAPKADEAAHTFNANNICTVCGYEGLMEYGFSVYSTQVTNKNKNDILGNGVFNYDPASKTLTVHKSYLSPNYGCILENQNVEGLVVSVPEDVTLSAYQGFLSKKDMTITGPGHLTVSTQMTTTDMMDGSKLVIKDIAIDAECDQWGIAGEMAETLVIQNSTIKAKGPRGAICDFDGGITLTGCKIVKPIGGYVKNGDVVDASGNLATEVVIAKNGDANLDGVVDIADVVAVLNAMASDLDAPQFKVNDDNVVDIADVVAVLNIMAQQ